MVSKVIIFELILMLSSVFIFRSFWMWLDRCFWLHTDQGLWVSLFLGILGVVWSLTYIHKYLYKK